MPLIEQHKERYLRAPQLHGPSATAPAGTAAELRAIAWVPGGERVERFFLDAHGEVLAERAGALVPEGIMRLCPMSGEPAQDSAGLLFAQTGGDRVEVAHLGGHCEVRLHRPGGSVLVFAARGMVAAPAVARAPGGTWVAFHHDVREDNGAQDVAKWIALRFVDDAGSVFAPSAPMTDRDRDRDGEEQSFEFPSLVVGEDGAVALFGRGSHCFWRQDLSAAGFGPRVALSDGMWGSRGRWVACIGLPGGALLTTQREKKGLLVQRADGPRGGAPALTPTPVAPVVVDAVPSAQRHDPATAHGRRTYFGDIQQHSAHSDGVGSADEVYLRARHRYDDDFVALTDHESFLGKRTGPGEWAYLQDVADRHDAPGAFTTLIAYEWTGRMHPGPGHKCVYLPTRGLPIISRDELPEGGDAVRAITELGGFASPHHIGWTGCDEAGHDPVGQPVWEICSCHGCYEHADHPLGQRGEHHHQLVDVMLKKGHRFGFTASSDSHGLLWHHGESRKRDPYRTGLTAVQAETLTRDAIFDAIRQRRCYGTSGAKILLDMTVDGAPMGSELDETGPREVRARAVGENDVARIELITEAGVVARAEGDARQAALVATVDARFVYARVVQHDGEMAWASPVFMGPVSATAAE